MVYKHGMYQKRQVASIPPFRSGRGSVGRNWRIHRRRKEDSEWAEREKKRARDFYHAHREECVKKRREWDKRLSEAINRHCSECGKLLNYRTKGDYCQKHCKR